VVEQSLKIVKSWHQLRACAQVCARMADNHF
jgi:hypothetical protein